MELNKIYNEDCFETLRRLPDASVDLMLTDPPYGVTQNDWDKPINLAELWLEWERVVKPNGAFVFTSQQPFTSDLIISRRGLFRYEIIWYKQLGSGFLNAKKMPLRNHENILVFYRQLPTYNPQMRVGKKKTKGRKEPQQRSKNCNYGNFKDLGLHTNDIYYPESVIDFTNGDRTSESDHPTQKPVDLFRYLVRTYSNPGDVVFDGYMGSGTTAVACHKEGRNYIGSEINLEYYNKAADRLSILKQSPELFG